MSTPLSQTPFQQLLIHPRCFNSIKPNGCLLFHVGLLFHNSQSRFFRTTYQVVYMPFKNTYALQKKSNNCSFDHKNFGSHSRLLKTFQSLDQGNQRIHLFKSKEMHQNALQSWQILFLTVIMNCSLWYVYKIRILHSFAILR